MKTLSIQQPWAWAILHGKPVENRDWYTKVRGTVLIHAGKKVDYDAFSFIEEMGLKIPEPNERLTGGIVGAVDIIDCVTKYSSKWFFGKYGFVLSNAIAVPFFPCRGQLGFFEVDYPYMKALKC